MSHPRSRRRRARRTIGDVLRRLRIDPFLVLLLLTVGVAIVVPGAGRGGRRLGRADHGRDRAAVLPVRRAAVHPRGARRAAALAAARDGAAPRRSSCSRCSAWPLVPAAGSVLPPQLAAGVLFLCLLPSTVQSSIAFTSIARGNVAAAICSASLSNLARDRAHAAAGRRCCSPRDGAGSRRPAVLGHRAAAARAVRRRPAGAALDRRLGPAQAALLTLVDRGSILLVVYTAFSAGVAAGIWHQLDAGRARWCWSRCDAVLLAVVLRRDRGRRRGCSASPAPTGSPSCSAARRRAWPAGCRWRACCSPARAVGLIVLPLMLFHQIQLMVCATLAGRLARRRAGRAAEPVTAS